MSARSSRTPSESPTQSGFAMKAAVVTAFTEALEIVEREVPAPSTGQILVRLETCGLCQTDIHAARGDWPVQPRLPFVPGHEGIGIRGSIRRRRDEPPHRRAGRHRMARNCVRTLPILRRWPRDPVRGAAQQRLLDRRCLRRVRRRQRGLRRAGARRHQLRRCGATQLCRGGLGHLAVQYAAILGGSVVAIDIADDKLEHGARLPPEGEPLSPHDHAVTGTRRGRRSRPSRMKVRAPSAPHGHSQQDGRVLDRFE
jgi:propanol-preferring alcohol dehydrogenase